MNPEGYKNRNDKDQSEVLWNYWQSFWISSNDICDPFKSISLIILVPSLLHTCIRSGSGRYKLYITSSSRQVLILNGQCNPIWVSSMTTHISASNTTKLLQYYKEIHCKCKSSSEQTAQNHMQPVNFVLFKSWPNWICLCFLFCLSKCFKNCFLFHVTTDQKLGPFNSIDIMQAHCQNCPFLWLHPIICVPLPIMG